MFPPAYFCSVRDNDTGGAAPNGSTSFLACFSHFGAPPIDVPAGSSLRLGTVLFDIPSLAAPGAVTLDLRNAVLSNELIGELNSCAPFAQVPMPCLPATIILEAPPTPTPTPAGPALRKIPESCVPLDFDNCDPDIPAANLWLCVTGPCDGSR